MALGMALMLALILLWLLIVRLCCSKRRKSQPARPHNDRALLIQQPCAAVAVHPGVPGGAAATAPQAPPPAFDEAAPARVPAFGGQPAPAYTFDQKGEQPHTTNV